MRANLGIVAFSVLVSASTAFADNGRAVDGLASQLVDRSVELSREVNSLDGGTNRLWSAQQAVSRLVQSANHLHAMIRTGAASWDIVRDVELAAREFHAVEREFDRVGLSVADVAARPSSLLPRGVVPAAGAVDPRLGRLASLMDDLRVTVESLQADVQFLATASAPVLIAPPIVERPIVRPIAYRPGFYRPIRSVGPGRSVYRRW